MARNNAYLARQQAIQKAVLSFHRKFTMHWCEDAAILAANEVFHRRGEILVEFRNAFIKYVELISNMARTDVKDDKEMVYTKEKIDAELRELLGDAFVPWDERHLL